MPPLRCKTYEKILRSQENPVADIEQCFGLAPTDTWWWRKCTRLAGFGGGNCAGDQIIKIDDTDLTPENSAK